MNTKLEIDLKKVQNIIKNEQDILNLKDNDYNIEKTEQNRGTSLYAQPLKEENPFISASIKKIVNGKEIKVNLIWSKFENGVPPDSASSKSAYREDTSLPSAIQYSIIIVDEKVDIVINEVLYVIDKGFSRYIFKDNIIDSMWNFFDNGTDKLYEVQEPLFIRFYPSGKKKEVWFFNPQANDFKSAAATLRMTDNKPVVITYYEDGEIFELDYTGYVFSKKIHPSINAFPFGSRYAFYEPSYIQFPRDQDGGKLKKIEKFFFQQEEKNRDSIYDALEGFGVDTETPKNIAQSLDNNPMFDELIRNMLGVAILKDEDLDRFNKL